MCRPLKYPEVYHNKKSIRWFLNGIPYIGIGNYVRRDICKQLKKRNKECLNLWKVNFNSNIIITEISEIIKKNMGFPNNYFIPEDPMVILLLDPSISLNDVCCLTQIIEKYNLPETVLEKIASMTYGEFINEVLKFVH